MRAMCLLLGLGLVCASVREVEAQKKPPAAEPTDANRELAKRHNDLGMNHYNLGEFDEAVAEFKAAYALTSEPGLLFNIAQAYRLAKDCAKALLWYRKFLADVPTAPNAETVKKYIAEQEAACPAGDASPAPGATHPVETGAPATPDQPAPARNRELMRNVGIGALGVSAIGVTMGIIYTFRVRAREDDRNHLCPAPCTWTEELTAQETDLKQRGERASKIAIASYAVGGAALAAGITMLVMSRDRSETGIALVPTNGGAFVSLTFAR